MASFLLPLKFPIFLLNSLQSRIITILHRPLALHDLWPEALSIINVHLALRVEAALNRAAEVKSVLWQVAYGLFDVVKTTQVTGNHEAGHVFAFCLH